MTPIPTPILLFRTTLAAIGIFTAFCALLLGCQGEKNLAAGQYAVADAEYSQDNYGLRREFRKDGSFTEAHSLSNCLLMEMKGQWVQKGDELRLQYAESRQRASCKVELPSFAPDSAQLVIPIRNVETQSFESFLTASDGKPEKWLRWNREG
jgi:hypothetical protein